MTSYSDRSTVWWWGALHTIGHGWPQTQSLVTVMIPSKYAKRKYQHTYMTPLRKGRSVSCDGSKGTSKLALPAAVSSSVRSLPNTPGAVRRWNKALLSAVLVVSDPAVIASMLSMARVDVDIGG
jgi:hypothetical protein